MTSILAIIKQNTPEDNDKPFAVAVADGQGSGGGTKSSGHQKLYFVGGNYLLGTGPSDKIIFIAKELGKQKKQTPSDAAIETYTLMERYFVPKDDGLDFIIMGRENDHISCHYLQTNRFKKSEVKTHLAIGGSGTGPISNTLDRDGQLGMPQGWNTGRTIGDVLYSAWDLSMCAVKSIGVNEQLQYGFITPDGSAALLHPEVRQDQPLVEYCENNRYSQQKAERNNGIYREFHKLTSASFNVRQNINALADVLASNSDAPEDEILEGIKELARQQRYLKGALGGLVMNYVREHNK
jgi:hypothetical protein